MQPKAIILRAPQRAAATVAALERLGISSSCVQLIETIWPSDPTALHAAVGRLRRGDYQWTVFTSVTTVQVIAQLLGPHRIPAGTRLAAVGVKTAEQVRALLHREVDFVPEVQSAAGMVRQWHLAPGTRVFYPHGDLAAPTLADGLRSWGSMLDEVIAYRTVAAGTGAEPVSRPMVPPGLTVLEPADLPARLPETDLLLFAAPSIVDRFVQVAGTQLPDRTATLAIGEPTAQAMTAAGLRRDATATDPVPEALAAAAGQLLKTRTENR